jgi:LysM repeat protein
MIIKKHGLIMIALFLIGALLISSCKISLSQAPLTTPTLIPTGLFVSPLPSVENPMEMIEQFARASQTAAVLSGTPGIPVTASTITTPQTGTPGTPTNAIPTTPLPYTLTPGGPTWTPLPPISKPSTYTLQKGEFPYCIARRFNVNPQELLSINGLAPGDLYPPSMVLTIPQSGGPVPGDRALHSHPTTYTVPSSDNTIYSVACYFGDVDPAAIANANGISVSADLTTGQQLTIP